jgi:hypothetical protein
MTGAIVDGVAYSVPQLRALLRERHDLAMELALCRDTLRRRTDALNRTAEENAPAARGGRHTRFQI